MVTYSMVAGFNAATGFEANGIGNGTVGLTNPGSGIFTLQVGSSCIGLGNNTDGVTEDYSGATFSDPPSSGVYQ